MAEPKTEDLRHSLAGKLKIAAVVLTILVLGVFVSQRNYLLFHLLAELFSVVVAAGIFMFAWNSRQVSENGFVLLLGLAYLFVGLFDLLHALSFKGMHIMAVSGSNLPTQLWVAARAIESVSLLGATFLLGRRLRPWPLVLTCAVVSGLLLLSIFSGHFPDCFREGQGLTLFKITLEYAFCVLLAVTLLRLYRLRANFSSTVFRLVAWSLVSSIASELSFTLYADPYGLFNMIGHLLKILSFYLVYRAVIFTGLQRPVELLFHRLSRQQDSLRRSEAALSEAQHMAHLGNWSWDLATGRVLWSDEVYNILGLDPAEHQPRREWIDYIHPGDRDMIQAAVEQAISEGDSYDLEVCMLHSDGTPRHVRAIGRLDYDPLGCPSRLVGVLLDIHAAKLAAVERDKLISELETALANVHTLSGMLPICCSCKKIRDDSGYWRQVEEYISAHSDADFTHGLCPECHAKAMREMEATFQFPVDPPEAPA
ncbi:PAS domain-containing protein [bacterium]|nr:PAS domain-containing protein [bacterium]